MLKGQNLKKKLIVTLMLASLVFINVSSRVMAYSPVELYHQVWSLINTKYVDQEDNQQDWKLWEHKYDNAIKTEDDAYVAIDTMLASLNDPYTRFLNPKAFNEEGESIKGTLKGIGIQIGIKEGKLLVIAPIEETPAEKAGLLAEDEIVQINGESTKGISIEQAADKIRGEEGTYVTLLVKRKGKEPATYKIARAEIQLKSVSVKPPKDMKVSDNVGYIRLSSFISKNAAKEMQDALVKLKDKDGYIIDLRSNPGGLLTNAIYISDMFLNGGVIVSTVDRDGYKETQRATTNANLTNKPVVILINSGSASASEIFSGAMKDNGRAILVGDKSFGKGLVQEINKLPGGSGVNITTQKYLTPNGTDINKKGIEPDIKVTLSEEDITKKFDKQLDKANEVLTKIIAEKKQSTHLVRDTKTKSE